MIHPLLSIPGSLLAGNGFYFFKILMVFYSRFDWTAIMCSAYFVNVVLFPALICKLFPFLLHCYRQFQLHWVWVPSNSTMLILLQFPGKLRKLLGELLNSPIKMVIYFDIVCLCKVTHKNIICFSELTFLEPFVLVVFSSHQRKGKILQVRTLSNKLSTMHAIFCFQIIFTLHN